MYEGSPLLKKPDAANAVIETAFSARQADVITSTPIRLCGLGGDLNPAKRSITASYIPTIGTAFSYRSTSPCVTARGSDLNREPLDYETNELPVALPRVIADK